MEPNRPPLAGAAPKAGAEAAPKAGVEAGAPNRPPVVPAGSEAGNVESARKQSEHVGDGRDSFRGSYQS